MTTIIDKIAWIHFQNGQVLCARSTGKDTYYLPGGKREAGETDEETLVREIEEEISVRIKPETISYFGTFEAEAHGKAEGVIVKMTCYIADFEGSLSPASEIDELSWLSYKDRNRVSVVTQIIFDQLHEHKLLS
ncbi:MULTISPECIES: NUDIX hydrolase [Paenibacillus]|uniref:NUDIX hydrolase n=1 Tax=Paenibacillus TaxID=44249 RepID=UPI0004F5B40F|nr:NUDIX domain-containing protein [Paenibacillus odorifer]AIQ74343.1 DNA mismatch repair protein MutT [Paenibacillus odorifer]MEC0133506.1 NUDIX domain-containing protein [Paenibacillus odorifer]MEC0224825.1 NUDIX domain-containing protein [Paenibacillus odorifer]OMD15327.1 DNA mismatch repair protein MutT [Paenibacillus odorifer]OME32870.1 DNA mismatch repair protein MutT [Paenibacillus odorifer]